MGSAFSEGDADFEAVRVGHARACGAGGGAFVVGSLAGFVEGYFGAVVPREADFAVVDAWVVGFGVYGAACAVVAYLHVVRTLLGAVVVALASGTGCGIEALLGAGGGWGCVFLEDQAGINGR